MWPVAFGRAKWPLAFGPTVRLPACHLPMRAF